MEIVEHPMNPFAAYCKRQGEDPRELWEAWHEAYEDDEIGLHRANQVTSSEDRNPMLVLGKIVRSTGDGLEGSGGESSMTPQEVQKECDGIRAFAAEVGLTDPVKVYLSAYATC